MEENIDNVHREIVEDNEDAHDDDDDDAGGVADGEDGGLGPTQRMILNK